MPHTKFSDGYIYLNKEEVTNYFTIEGNRLSLKDSIAKPIKINLPFKIDENVAKISAMLLDGSLNKNLSGVMFSQKKDKNKVTEFSKIVKEYFGLVGRFSIRSDTGTSIVTISSKTLSTFLHKSLGLSKSDEPTRIPLWVWNSPKSVVIEYLRYAYAMEGSINHPSKAAEIRFHSVSLPYIKDLKKLLFEKFKIDSKIQRYYIKDYGWKYFLYFCSRKNIIKFKDIGFALKSHQDRLEKVSSSFKNKSWEIMLVNILGLYKNIFTLNDMNKKFSYLCKRAVHWRLTNLVNMGYLRKEKDGYSITGAGYLLALCLLNRVRTTRLRTNPRKNEDAVLNFLNSNGKGYRNEIARKVGVHPATVRDTLLRLVKQQKIQLIVSDKFQRKFYSIKS